MTTYGQRLKEWRQFRGISRSALAAQLGVTRQAVLGWETDQYRPTDDKFCALCVLLVIPVAPRWQQEIPIPPTARRKAS